MSKLQENLTTIQSTINDLATVINDMSCRSGGDNAINACTSFIEYPNILRSIPGATSNGIATMFAYKISDINPGRPTSSGSFDFNTNTYSVPDGWVKADELNALDNDIIWMSQALFSENSDSESNLVGTWSAPIRIASFINPKEPNQVQSVYYTTNNPLGPANSPTAGLNDDAIDHSNPLNNGWSEYFSGIGPDHQYTFICTRNKTNGIWSEYTEPALYAHYAEDGLNGKDGIDGSNGIDGKDGLSTRTVFAFTSTSDINTIVDTPKGGHWNKPTNEIIFPDGWYASTDGLSDRYIWTSTAVFSDDIIDSPEWSIPSCITGKDGENGADGESVEFVYALLPNQDDMKIFLDYLISNDISLSNTEDDVLPEFISSNTALAPSSSIDITRPDTSSFTVTLTDSPSGIDAINNKVEICWSRNKINSAWSSWKNPILWSVWGENGMDGDGIQYIFAVNADNIAPNYPFVYDDETDPQSDNYIPIGWSNDPSSIGPDVPYLFCSIRRKSNGEWNSYSEPQLWGHWGKDGIGSYTSFAFCVSKEDLSQYTVTGGKYADSLTNLVTKDSENNEIEFTWYDSVPSIPKYDETIWMINKFFSNSANESEKAWYGPVKITDSEHFQVEFNCPTSDENSKYNGTELISLQDFKTLKESESISYSSIEELTNAWRSYVYETGAGLWNNYGKDALYMASCSLVNNVWSPWVINKIKGENGNVIQFIFRLHATNPGNPTPADLTGDFQSDDYKPENWDINPQSVSETYPICWVSKRGKTNDIWGSYSDPTEWSMYAKGNVSFELSELNLTIPCESDGSIDKNYQSHATVNLMLYDNGTMVTPDAYEAIINSDTDRKITNVLTEIPSDSSITGFYNNTLYIGKDILDLYKSDEKLRVECRLNYQGSYYAKTFTINKSTNAYELKLSHSVLVQNNDSTFKDDTLTIQVIKWTEDRFISLTSGYLTITVNFNDGSSRANTEVFDADSIHDLDLTQLTNVKSIEISYKESIDSEIVLASDVIGIVIDGKNGADGKDGVDGKDGIDGVDGTNGIDGINPNFTAFVFTRSAELLNSTIYTPTGGEYENPIPVDPSGMGIIWYDSIPEGTNTIWMSQRVFNVNNDPITTWSVPSAMNDTSDIDVAWSTSEEMPTLDPPGNGWLEDATNAIWMAVRTKKEGVWSTWKKSKIKGETGAKGDKGDSISSVIEWYAKHTSNATSPIDGWVNDYTIQLDETYKYLWNYEEIFVNGESFYQSTPQVISVYSIDGEPGRGISKIIDFFGISSDKNILPESWSETVLTIDPVNKYLWNYEIIEYTDGTESETDKIIIGVYGETGPQGEQGIPGDKGDKGDKGDDGESIQGASGAMMRMSEWTLAPKTTYNDDSVDGFYQSGDTTKWYDIVTHNDVKYRCIISHTPTSVTEPSIGSDWNTYWVEANEFEFVATKLLLSEKINADQIDVDNITVQSLNTRDTNETTSQPWVNIQKGVFDLYSSDGKKVLSLGTFGDDNKVYTGLMFYDEFGSVSYTIDGSRGLRDLSNSSSAEKTWKSYQSQYSVLTSEQQKDWEKSNAYATMLVSSTFWDGIVPLVVDEKNISSSETSVYKLTYYTIDTSGNRYAHSMNGYYFNTKDLSDNEFSNHLMNGAYIIKGEKEYTYYNDVPSQWYFEINQFNMHVSPVYQIPAISEMRGGIITRYPIYLYKNGQMLDPNSFVHYIYRYNEKL